jgi:hypothetical protein
MAAGFVDLVVPDRHSRRLMLAGLQRMSLLALLLLVAQYALGIVLNLYVAVPAADAHAGITQVITNGPLTLTLHVLLGLALVGTAIVLLVRAVVLGDRRFAVLAAGGLTTIGGAFAAGEIFVRNGQQFASAAMAILTAVALLCYIGTLTLASAAYRQVAHHRRRAMDPGDPDADDIETWPPDYETGDTGQDSAWPPDYDDDSDPPWRQSRNDDAQPSRRQSRGDSGPSRPSRLADGFGLPWQQSRDDRSSPAWLTSHDDRFHPSWRPSRGGSAVRWQNHGDSGLPWQGSPDDSGPAWQPSQDDSSSPDWWQGHRESPSPDWWQGHGESPSPDWRQDRDDGSGLPWRQSRDDPGLAWLPDSVGSGPNGRPSHDLDDADLGLIWTPDTEIPAPRPSWPDSGRSWSAPPGAR